jgi:lipoate-protein ligase A
MRLVRLENTAIFDQLLLEEALLRADQGNWCLFNTGSPPAVILGISSQIEEWINRDQLTRDPIPLIRRFSGGGTVVVGPQTLFVTLIVDRQAIPVRCFPEAILHWTGMLYASLLPKGLFRINANDYGIGDRKFGGNAQYLCRDRWLHHSSLLWDFTEHDMEYLRHPKRQPHYRANRAHTDFLCRLREHVAHKEKVFSCVENALSEHFQISACSANEAAECLKRGHRRTTLLISQLD